jgi:hypothetical protein
MNFSYNFKMDKNNQILFAFFGPIGFAIGVAFFIEYIHSQESYIKAMKDASMFGIHNSYSPPIDFYLGMLFYGLLLLSILLPSLIFMRNQPIERTELNLGSK